MAARPETVTSKNVDLSNCDREQIQFPGAILPHGVMLVLSEPELRILQASQNTDVFFGVSARMLLGQTLDVFLAREALTEIEDALRRERLDGPPVMISLTDVFTDMNGTNFHVLAHRIDKVLILEFEPEVIHPLTVAQLYSNLRASTLELQKARSLQQFLDKTVDYIREFTGFDRIMAYKFSPDGSGEVVAESVAGNHTRYLGQHFPPSDIPAPSRRLFSMTWLRHQPDINYTPVSMIPENNPANGGPLDMSYAILRSVSVMYTGYLKNMGTTASMVMTLLKEGKLWGLIACHHHSGPRHVSYEARLACEFLANVVSLLIAEKEDLEHSEYNLQRTTNQDRLIQSMSRTGEFFDSLTSQPETLLDLIRSTGAAIVADGKVVTLGKTPNESQIQSLIQWLASGSKEVVFSTDSLPKLLLGADAYKDSACGVLALRFSVTKKDFILWFRPEIIQTIKWAGDPRKPVDISDDGQRLMPRTSFALWEETVHQKSEPWLEVELQSAREFRIAIMELIVRKAENLGELYSRLEQSYLELDSFTYVASHDLKEPLRGIHNYARFLLEDCEELLREEDVAKLRSVIRLSQRMENLLDSLLKYSRASRKELETHQVNTNAVLREVLEALNSRIEESRARVKIEDPMPVIRADAMTLGEIFANLISNAIKYNDKPERAIEIGCVPDQSQPTFYVRDNGIGIDPAHFEDVFTIFRRLHAVHEFGGGNGAGLTIARKLAERHGGKMWLESTVNEGSTFYFSVQEK